MGRRGFTIVEIAAEFDVARNTLYDWIDTHPNFSNAISRARDLAEAWWAKQGRKGIWSREFNSSAYRLQMMNRFGWGERSSQEVYHGDVKDADDDELRKRAEELTNRVAAMTQSENGDGAG